MLQLDTSFLLTLRWRWCEICRKKVVWKTANVLSGLERNNWQSCHAFNLVLFHKYPLGSIFFSCPSRVLSLFLCKVAPQRTIQSYSGDVVTLILNPRFVCTLGVSLFKFKMSNHNLAFVVEQNIPKRLSYFPLGIFSRDFFLPHPGCYYILEKFIHPGPS